MSNQKLGANQNNPQASAHLSGINIGKDSKYIKPEELHNYLVRVGDKIDPQEKEDLLYVMRHFRQISDADGKKAGKGISFEDMNAYVVGNMYNDHIIELQRQYTILKQENAQLRGLANRVERREAPPVSGRPGESGRVITDKLPNGHYRAEGMDVPLSQEEFKRHYGIPQEIDLLKFMPGKPNDGTVPDYWSSGASVGLGGRMADGSLKWDHADRHDLKYDFSRNFAQVFKYLQALPPEKQTEFAFNFARTQAHVFKANGYDLKIVDNEKVYAEGETSGWTDFVQDVDSDHPLIQW
ncbi:MAG TPA: hypothetical protein V6D17_22980 [Candidatus Obscuribacterales bacterium]